MEEEDFVFCQIFQRRNLRALQALKDKSTLKQEIKNAK